MNYLAHAYLSFNKPGILTGNMISDYVKGKAKLTFPEGIQKGISLHRHIDAFTDNHEATKEAKNIFKSAYRLYSGAFIDVVYDHFLANDNNEFSGDKLSDFALDTYGILEAKQEYFPERFAKMFPYMQQQNWLYNYQHRWGIQKSMQGVVHRSKYLTESDIAFLLFEKNYHQLQLAYDLFWPDVKRFTIAKLAELENL